MTYSAKYRKTGADAEAEADAARLGSGGRNDYRRPQIDSTESTSGSAESVDYMLEHSRKSKLDLRGFELKPVRISAEQLGVSQRTTQFTGPVESLNGIVVKVEDQNAIIKFTKGVNTLHRSIGLTTLQKLCEHKISPGDRVALRTYRAGRNCFQTMWRYLGKGTVKLSLAQVDHLDKLFQETRKKRK